MRAFALESFETKPHVTDIPTPEIAPNEVLVRVHAASLNAFDTFVASGMAKGMMEYQFPVVIGKDLAGVIEAVGADVTRYAPGDEVIAMIAGMGLHDGSFAEYAAIPEDGPIAAKPARLNFTEAASLPLAGAAALATVDALAPAEGDRVLIVGATGGVGSFAVQLVAQSGAEVIATALPGDEAHLRALGARETINYKEGSIAEAIRNAYPDGINGLLDVVSYADGFAELAALVVPGGRAVSILRAANVEQLATRDVRATNVSASPTSASFSRLATLADAGQLRPLLQRVYPLEEANEAIDHMQNGHVVGKIAISIAEA